MEPDTAPPIAPGNTETQAPEPSAVEKLKLQLAAAEAAETAAQQTDAEKVTALEAEVTALKSENAQLTSKCLEYADKIEALEGKTVNPSAPSDQTLQSVPGGTVPPKVVEAQKLIDALEPGIKWGLANGAVTPDELDTAVQEALATVANTA